MSGSAHHRSGLTPPLTAAVQIAAEIGVYIPVPTATSTTLTGLTGGADAYSVAVRSQTSDGRLSLPFEPAAAAVRIMSVQLRTRHILEA
jgi:hypothetical protein